jgi:hypothetical protein
VVERLSFISLILACLLCGCGERQVHNSELAGSWVSATGKGTFAFTRNGWVKVAGVPSFVIEGGSDQTLITADGSWVWREGQKNVVDMKIDHPDGSKLSASCTATRKELSWAIGDPEDAVFEFYEKHK